MEAFLVMTISRKTLVVLLVLLAWRSSAAAAADKRRTENVEIDSSGLELVINCDSDALSKFGVNSGDIGRAAGALLDSGQITYDAIKRLPITTQEGKRLDLAMLPVELVLRKDRETPNEKEATSTIFTVPRWSIQPKLISKQGLSKKEEVLLVEACRVLLKGRRGIDLNMKIIVEGSERLVFEYFELIVKLQRRKTGAPRS